MKYREISEEKIILALDGLSKEDSLDLVRKIGESVYAVKIHDLYDRFGPDIVPELMDAGASIVWVDAKLYDIPTTVARRTKAIAESGAGIITVHASGGKEMMKAAIENIARVYAVTVLTSLGSKTKECRYGFERSAPAIILACDAREAGVRGVVCSGKEVCTLPFAFANSPSLEFIVPGIRMEKASQHDHLQVCTPGHAIKDGASRLVIGRPITEAEDPVIALGWFAEEIAFALETSI